MNAMQRILRGVMGACAAGLVLVAGAAPADAGAWRYARAVDGDTIQLGNGQYVRLLGFDTPEVGQCGYYQAKSTMASLLIGGVRLENRSGRDHYGRLLAYVKTDEGRDVGSVMIRNGLARARYDSRDGYGWHPKQRKYHRLTARSGSNGCPRYPGSSAKPGSSGSAFANCDAARRAGAAPVRRGDPGYGSHLDGDGDGVACE